MLPTVAPWRSYKRFGKGEDYYTLGEAEPIWPPPTPRSLPSQGISNGASGIQALDPKGPHSFFFILAAHQNLASKIFSSCCKCCEKPDAADDSKIPNQTQELQLSKHGRYQARMPCPASGDLILLIPLLLRCPQISFSFWVNNVNLKWGEDWPAK